MREYSCILGFPIKDWDFPFPCLTTSRSVRSSQEKKLQINAAAWRLYQFLDVTTWVCQSLTVDIAVAQFLRNLGVAFNLQRPWCGICQVQVQDVDFEFCKCCNQHFDPRAKASPIGGASTSRDHRKLFWKENAYTDPPLRSLAVRKRYIHIYIYIYILITRIDMHINHMCIYIIYVYTCMHIHHAFPKQASILGQSLQIKQPLTRKGRVQGIEYHCLETSSRTPRWTKLGSSSM